MAKVVRSAGLVMCRVQGEAAEFLLAHPGGPFFSKRDAGVWTIPKGLIEPSEEPQAAAVREFQEETSMLVGDRPLFALGEIRQKSGKRVLAWAFVGDCDPSALRSNTFSLAWPPRSGRSIQVPELDRYAFFGLEQAREKILSEQWPLLERACAWISGTPRGS